MIYWDGFPVLPMDIFLQNKDSHDNHDVDSLVEFKFKKIPWYRIFL